MQQVKLIEASVIRAASLEYTCDSLNPGSDAILSTCDSCKCSGQVKPTAEIDSVEYLSVSYTTSMHICDSGHKAKNSFCRILMYRYHGWRTAVNQMSESTIHSNGVPPCLTIKRSVQLSHQDFDGVTERLAMSKAFFYRQHLDTDCIKNGISNLLAGYPILAGRLGRTAGTVQPLIWLNNAGVHFRHLYSSASRQYFQANNLSASSRQGTALPTWTEVKALEMAKAVDVIGPVEGSSTLVMQRTSENRH